MAKLPIINWKQESIGEFELADSICQARFNPFLIKDAVTAHMANKRQGTHKAKDRSEVKGSTRKLFRQKGTGNARAGSAKSPIRRHGGVTFGPVPRDHQIKINKKTKKTALKLAFSQNLRENKICILDGWNLETHKTKELHAKLAVFKWKKALLVYAEQDPKLSLATRNLPYFKAISVNALNVYDMLKYQNMLCTTETLKQLQTRLET